jgi:3',5'-cyclic AMP phosphodiesterase CpdA
MMMSTRKKQVSYISKRHHFFLTILIMTILMSCSFTRTTTDTKPFFFFQMADTQFGMFTNDSVFTKETINFEKAIESANRLRPSFVVVCGDLVNQLENQQQIAEYKRIAAKLDPSIPLYNVAGNHDIGTTQPTEKGLSNYRKHFGPDYYSFRSGNLYGIVLNSSLFFDPSLVPLEADRQDAWLRSTLEKASKIKNVSIVVFQHIPWFTGAPDEKNGYFNIPLARRRTYLDLFHKHGIKHIFAGHFHKNSIAWDGDLEMITTGPVGKPLGKDPSGFRIVTLKGSKINHTYYSLDSIPANIRLNN